MPVLPNDIIELIISFVDFTTEVVINASYGGFYEEEYCYGNRDCERLVRRVKNSARSDLKVVKVDNRKTWFITQYDGAERIYYAEDIKKGHMFINGDNAEIDEII